MATWDGLKEDACRGARRYSWHFAQLEIEMKSPVDVLGLGIVSEFLGKCTCSLLAFYYSD